MTFTTPNDKAAWIAGITVEEYEAQQEIAELFDWVYGEDALDREERRFIDVSDIHEPWEVTVTGYGSDHGRVDSLGSED